MKIAIIGTVGIGKTTISNAVKEFINIEDISVNIEEEKYAYLEKAYNDMPRYAKIMQIDFLMLRLRTLSNDKSNKKYSFYDRSYIDDFIYAKRSFEKGEMNEDDFNDYKKLFEEFSKIIIEDGLNYDQLIILKRPESDTADIRRKKRDRFNESELTHFREIDEAYESEWFMEHCKKFVDNVNYVIADNPNEAAKKILSFIQR